MLRIKWFLFLALTVGTTCLAQDSKTEKPKEDWKLGEWKSIFNGKDLAGWEVNDFAGSGEVKVEDGKIILNTGVALTGIRYTNDLPKTNYEILVRSMKQQGQDFFSAITFSVKDSHATFLNGGWGGSLVGISSIDGLDASENETTAYKKFEVNQWYEFRVRVMDKKLQAFIDDEKVVDVVIADRKISMRPGEIEAAVPFGLSTWQTTGVIKEVKIRTIPSEIKKIAFIAGRKSHGPGEHEYEKSLRWLKNEIEKNSGLIAVDTDLHLTGWPVDEEDLRDASTIVLFSDGSDRNKEDHPLLKYERWKVMDKLMKWGAGLVCIHYSVFVPKEDLGDRFLNWIGGYFDYQSGDGPNRWYSKIETRDYKVEMASPDHPISKGVKPFEVREEFYFNIRFPEGYKGVTPIATFDPDKKDWSKVVGWAIERPDGARGFGYTGGHFYKNFENENVKRMLVNAILWTAKTDVKKAEKAQATNWPQWRGPDFNGSATVTGLPSTWSKENVLWKAVLPGQSGSTPIVWEDYIFVNSPDKEKNLNLLCLDRKTGKTRWSNVVGIGDRVVGRNNMASPSPVTDGKIVITMFGTGDLAAFDFAGNQLWSKNITKDYGKFSFMWLYGSSPLLYDCRLYVQVLQRNPPDDYGHAIDNKPQRESFLLCLDPNTGDELWRQLRPTDALKESQEAYSTPIPMRGENGTEIIVVGGNCTTGHDPVTGQELWRAAGLNRKNNEWWRIVPSPVPGSELVYSSAPKREPVFAIQPGGRGNVTTTHTKWSFDEYPTDCSTPLYYQDKLIVLDGDRKMVTCLDGATGEKKWQGKLDETGPIWCSPTGADGKIYIISERGTIFVLEAGNEFKVLSKIEMGEGPVRSSIVAAQGQLFIRTAESLYCVGNN